MEKKGNILEEGTGLSSTSEGNGVNILEEQKMKGKGSKLHLSSWPLPPAISIKTLGGLQLVQGEGSPKVWRSPHQRPSSMLQAL